MEDYELILFDRINAIRDTVNKYGEENFYIAFSGGKDSTILHYLIDMAIPNNSIPRVFVNTGIEYNLIYEFVKALANQDERFKIIPPSIPLKMIFEKYGYPPYNFERTGCCGCPFNLKLQSQLDIMAKFLPQERSKCEILWKPVYEEYRRIGYRLKENKE